MNGMEHIRPARTEDLNRIAEIEIFNYRLYFYPIFRSDRYYFGEKTVPNLPVLQDQGIGGALFRYAVDALGGRRLFALEKNLRAIRFYERHGFHKTGERKRVDDTNEFLIRMEK